MYCNVSSSYLVVALGGNLSSPCSPSWYSLPLSVFHLHTSCSFLVACCHHWTSHAPLSQAAFTEVSNVLLTLDLIPFVTFSSKAAVVSPAIFCSSYNTQPTLCFPALPASSPWICHGVTNFLAPPWSLVAAGWLVTLQRIHIQSLTCHPAGCLTDIMPIMPIFINPLVRKPCKLVGNYLCSAWHPWKTRKHVHVTLPLGISF